MTEVRNIANNLSIGKVIDAAVFRPAAVDHINDGGRDVREWVKDALHP